MGIFYSSEYSTVSSHVDECSSELYLIDYDVDNTSSMFSKLVTSNKKEQSSEILNPIVLLVQGVNMEDFYKI
jgi:hypothetical protein